MKIYWIVETRGGPGNYDCLSQTEHRTEAEAQELAERVGGVAWSVIEQDNVRLLRRVDQ